MKKILFFLMITCIPFKLFCEDEQPQDQQEEELMEHILEEIDEKELEDLLGQIMNNIEPAPPPPSPEELRISSWDKFNFFRRLPLAMKWDLFKEHVKAHKVGYSVGGGLTTAASIALAVYFLYYKRRGQQQNG